MRENVSHNEELFRRGFGSPLKRYMNPDGTATSRVFKLRESDNGELSVDVKSLTTPEVAVKDETRHILFEISVQSVLNLDLEVKHDPLPNTLSTETNPAHAVILGMQIEDDITPGLLAKKSKRVYIKGNMIGLN